MTKNFSGIAIGALRNTSGNGRVIRILDARHLHDSVWDELAAKKGLTWDAKNFYLCVEYPVAKESVDPVSGRLVLDETPIAPFKAAVYSDFVLAQADYIGDAQVKAGKTRRAWRSGKMDTEEDE